MNINFRINPNAVINSYAINVDNHSQSTMKERNTWDNSMFQIHSQYTKSVKKMHHHIPNEVKSLILSLLLLFDYCVKK